MKREKDRLEGALLAEENAIKANQGFVKEHELFLDQILQAAPCKGNLPAVDASANCTEVFKILIRYAFEAFKSGSEEGGSGGLCDPVFLDKTLNGVKAGENVGKMATQCENLVNVFLSQVSTKFAEVDFGKVWIVGGEGILEQNLEIVEEKPQIKMVDERRKEREGKQVLLKAAMQEDIVRIEEAEKVHKAVLQRELGKEREERSREKREVVRELRGKEETCLGF